MHRPPNVGDRRGGNPPPRTGCPSCTVTQARRRHAMVVAHFFESGQRRRSTLGPSRERTANGRRSSAGQHRVHSCDRRKGLGGGHVGSARASRVSPQREPALPTETAREQSTRGARSSHPFGAGAGSQPSLRPPGTGCSPAKRYP